MSQTPTAEMALAVDRKRGSGSGYDRDAAYEKNYSKKYDRQVKQRGIRGGLRGASSAAGVALLQLIDVLNNDGG